MTAAATSDAPPAAPTPSASEVEAFLAATLARTGRGAEAVVPILQAIQARFRYLPADVLRRVCELTEITPAAVEGVSTFYAQFRHRPCGKHRLRICHGTACHVQGSALVDQELRRLLKMADDQDTDPTGTFTVEPVACLGCCTLAPVVQVDAATLGKIGPDQAASVLTAVTHQGAADADSLIDGAARPGRRGEVRIGAGSCCQAKGSGEVLAAIQHAVQDLGVDVAVKRVGCVGRCYQTPLLEIRPADGPPQVYADVPPSAVRGLVQRHFPPRSLAWRLGRSVNRLLDRVAGVDAPAGPSVNPLVGDDCGVAAFMQRQHRVATEHFGELDPLDCDEYLRHDGFVALRTAWVQAPERVVQAITTSGLRGRGGAGFPSGTKWARVRAAAGETKFVICNGDEGDPGAFMDRMILESFPYRVIEGLAIAAYAVGAREGIFYIREEYPLAVRRVQAAIDECARRGLLRGATAAGPFELRLQIRQGAGAFVCGEETALIASIEGQRGTPRLRPPYPADHGLWGRPTLVNNVETLALVPWIVRHGAVAFAGLGTPRSTGTKVFALAGKVQRGGLIEVPMGLTIRQIVEDIGGGVPPGRQFKAVQLGGPSGGCIPAALADTPVDYEALAGVGAIMGSGGLIVLDDSDCMVDIARYFLQFTQDQSCGKCTFCRVGTRRMLDVLDRICAGQGKAADLAELERLCHQVQHGSLCGLGKTAPNPVLTTLQYFRAEYEAHLQGRCPAGRCKALIRYRVKPTCTGCTVCAQHCPTAAIALKPYQIHQVQDDLCTRCGVCIRVCPEHAVEVV